MATNTKDFRSNGAPNNRANIAPLASLREPVYPTMRAAKSAKKTAMVVPLASEGNFQTLKMKTNQSQWTPLSNKPSNEQVQRMINVVQYIFIEKLFVKLIFNM